MTLFKIEYNLPNAHKIEKDEKVKMYEENILELYDKLYNNGSHINYIECEI